MSQIGPNMNATGGGVNASQTVSLNSKCQDLILKSGTLPQVRENVLVPVLEYLAHDSQPKLTLRDDPIKVMWHLFRQGAFMCELLNQVQPGVIQSIALPIAPMSPNNFNDMNSRQNVAAFIKASRDMFFLTDDQLFNPGDMYKEDFIAFSKAVILCEMYLNNKIRVSSRSSQIINSHTFDDDIAYLFDIRQTSVNLDEIPGGPKSAGLAAVSMISTSEGLSRNLIVSKRAHILEEMIASERVYVDDLARLNKYKEQIKFERLLSQKTIDSIFANLKDVLNFQRKFMIEMESLMQKPKPDFGGLFKTHEADFSVYEMFCLNHSDALVAIKENMKILKTRADLLDVVGDIEGYMIKPIQRVTRYSLFLRDIVKDATKRGDEEEAKNATEAAESVKRIANRINERQRAAENEKIAADFYEHFRGKVANPEKTGKLILHDASMKVRLEDEIKVYRVYLFQRKLIMCSEKDVFGPFWVKNRITLETVKEVQDAASNEPSVPFAAHIKCLISDKEASFQLLFRTQQMQRMWIQSIRSLAQIPELVFNDKIEEISPVAFEEIKQDSPELKSEPVKDIQLLQVVEYDVLVKVLFRDEYFCLVLSHDDLDSITVMELMELVHDEIVKAYRLEYQKTSDIPSVDRLRLRFKNSDGIVARLSNDDVLTHLLKNSESKCIDLVVHESEPIRVRVHYRDCLYSFTIDDLSALEELKIYVYETIAEDYRIINANVDAIPKGDAMRLFFKENDDQWSLLLYDNDVEVALKESNRRIDVKL